MSQNRNVANGQENQEKLDLMAELRAELDALKAKNAELEQKVKSQKETKHKGDLVEWEVDGKKIRGYAQKYYYMTIKGENPKMKEVSKVTVIERNVFDIKIEEYPKQEEEKTQE